MKKPLSLLLLTAQADITDTLTFFELFFEERFCDEHISNEKHDDPTRFFVDNGGGFGKWFVIDQS